jgi:hypothetical protein
MSPTPALAHTAKLLETPRLDQRLHRRYPITLELEYKLLRKGPVARLGFGKTLNVSSGDILFETEDALPVGSPIEVLMDWPFLLDDRCSLKLVIQGSVVRSDSQLVAVRFKLYEFRTAGTRSSSTTRCGAR